MLPKYVENDKFLLPFSHKIEARHLYANKREKEITAGEFISDFANGYLYYGLHKSKDKWIFREYAPNATAIYIVGDCNGWQKNEDYRLQSIGNGSWQGVFQANQFKHGQLYKLLIEWQGGCGERLPAYARRVVQDSNTKIFSAQVWQPLEPYRFKVKSFRPKRSPLLIYECHIGMATEEEKVGTYREFKDNILPKVAKGGYNCLQIMGIQEHPYYGSFGYHVSNFFAASSRFGTPEELKELIDEAHKMGIAVIMDLVHSHSVKNEVEGLGMFDGSTNLYFHQGERRDHRAWNSLCFDYGKNATLHFLLSNCKFWLEEYKFDGFRFDGVTSMMYLNHGLETDFLGYEDYFNGNQDEDAICYLTLANKLIHQTNPHAITIAEDVSGMPLLASKIENCGIGFDYRMAMGIPDFFIKYIKEVPDEHWKVGHIFWQLTNRRQEEKTISYAESHDQAIVGDKTIIFRLADSDMYWHFERKNQNICVSRAVALHKMIKIFVLSTINGGYLNFMGNEFGHPEWIDFPREGNKWSYKYARRQWSLSENEDYLYYNLKLFDQAMIEAIVSENRFCQKRIEKLLDQETDQVIVFKRGNLIFAFNFSPKKSFTDYGVLVPKGSYDIVLNTDDIQFGGFGLIDTAIRHYTLPSHLKNKEWLRMYLPARSAIVLKKID